MSHNEYIKANFNVIAEVEGGILFEAYGELVGEYKGQSLKCSSKEEF